MGVVYLPSLNPVCLVLHVQKTWLPWKQCIQEMVRGCVRAHVSVCMCVWDWSVGMVKYVCLKGRQTFLQGMTGIKDDEEVCSSLCVPMGGREGGRWGCGRGCLSVLVDPAGDCSQIQLIPTGCFHLSTSDEEKKKKRQEKKKAESPEVQYLVCINLWPIPLERLVIISIPPSVRRTSAALLWHVGLGNEKDKPWSFQTPTPVEEAHGPGTAPMSTTSPGKPCVRCVWGGAVYALRVCCCCWKSKKKRVMKLSKHADAGSHERMLPVAMPTLIKISFTYRLRNILTGLPWIKNDVNIYKVV